MTSGCVVCCDSVRVSLGDVIGRCSTMWTVAAGKWRHSQLPSLQKSAGLFGPWPHRRNAGGLMKMNGKLIVSRRSIEFGANVA